jgi:MarR family transcriptional regulator, 2-MHQ and catechol-resistance regulon repressor
MKMHQNGYRNGLNLDEKLMVGIVRVAEFFKKKSSAIFKNYGLTFSQYNVLRVLNSSTNGTNTVTNVSKIMLVTGANMTGLSKRLERDGFLLRKRDPKDERVTLLEISPKGKRTLKNIEEEKESHIKSYLTAFSDEEKRELLEDIRQMLRSEDS